MSKAMAISNPKLNNGLRQRATSGFMAAATLVVLTGMTGCGVGIGGAPTPIEGPALHGMIHGGQQPVSGSTLQLYAVGATGYGSAAAPLLKSTVVSGPDGSFSISGTYTCPSASTLVYITATGGNPGVGANGNLAMMAGLGACGNLSASTFVFINELTTVATVTALSPFMTGPTSIGSSAANIAGLSNAFDDINTLVDTAHGVVPGPGAPVGAIVPSSELNTLADAIAACVNSTGGSAGDGTPCGNLFNATRVGGTAPTDTATAAMNIAQHPAVNVGPIYGLATPGAPFQPTLATQPNDFTVAVNFTGGLNGPSALAADSAGNIWVANAGNNTVAKFSHTGALQLSTGASTSLPSAITVDAAGFIWIANKGSNTLSKISGSGTPVTGSPFTGGGLNQPRSLAFDALGNAWVANGGAASVSEFNSAGTPLSGSGYTGTGVTSPVGIAVSPH